MNCREAAEAVPSHLPDDSDAKALTGLTVMNLTKEIVRQLGFNRDEKGVVVARVEPGSLLMKPRLKRAI